MSDTTITPEERALWRKRFDSPFFDKGCKPFSLRALDALEDSDRRVSELTALLDASCEETRQNFSALYKTATEVIPALNAKIEQAEARAEKTEAENARQIMVSKALARKLAQATRTWGKAGNMDNSAGYWLAWAEHDADAEIKAARRAVADAESEGKR